MKALLRSSVLALIVFAAVSSFSASNLTVVGAGPYTPTCSPIPGATICVK